MRSSSLGIALVTQTKNLEETLSPMKDDNEEQKQLLMMKAC